MKKKFIRILLALLLTVGIFPAMTGKVKAEDVVIHSVSVGYDPYAVALRPGMTEKEVSNLFVRALNTLSLLPGTHYDKNCCYLVYKDAYGTYRSCQYSQELLSTDREYCFLFNVEEDSGYCWDVNQLPTVTVNGEPADDVNWYSGYSDPHGSVDVYQRVYVSTSADYVASVTINPYRVKIQKGSDKTVSAEVEGTVSTVQWTMYNNLSTDSFVTSTGRIIIASNERADTLTVRATSIYNPNAYDEIEVIISNEPVYISNLIVTPNPGYVIAGNWLTLRGEIEGTELNDFVWELVSDHNTGTFITSYYTAADLCVDKDEAESPLIIQCTSLHDPTTYLIISVFVDWPPVITDLAIDFNSSGLPLDTEHTGDDVTNALVNALNAGSVSGGAHFDTNCCYLAYLDQWGDYRQVYGSQLDNEHEYYLCINLEDNSGYMWDVDNLPNVTVNGKPADVIRWYSGDASADGSIDVLVRVYLSSGPSLTVQSMSTDGIKLSWSAMDGYSKYELYRNGVKIKTVTGTSYTDDIDGNVKWGQLRHMDTWYTYKVRGVNGTAHSDFGREIEVYYNPFSDVSPDDAVYPYIVWAYNNQIVNGTSSTTFEPTGDCERMNFCIMLWKIKNKPYQGKKTPFKDLGGLSTNNVKAITWCYNKKIVNGYTKTQFKPHNKITRAQLAIMIWKMAGKPSVEGMDCPYTDIEVTDSFTANNRKAVIWCYNKGLIGSITGDRFDPDKEGTRALLTEMMYGYVHL
ncbi:MAG: S-layer homology domain-containing protein [Erysipelotrichaceae bacterium]|nr:S-layer homology domain-containing protein [Erysipelotrichaceae bacterium]